MEPPTRPTDYSLHGNTSDKAVQGWGIQGPQTSTSGTYITNFCLNPKQARISIPAALIIAIQGPQTSTCGSYITNFGLNPKQAKMSIPTEQLEAGDNSLLLSISSPVIMTRE